MAEDPIEKLRQEVIRQSSELKDEITDIKRQADLTGDPSVIGLSLREYLNYDQALRESLNRSGKSPRQIPVRRRQGIWKMFRKAIRVGVVCAAYKVTQGRRVSLLTYGTKDCGS